MYAIALGASPDRLDLVFERDLRVLPSFALTLAQWVPDALGRAGAFDVSRAVHGAQRLVVLEPLERSGEIEIAGRVDAVWDKGSAAVFDVTAESTCFRATWSIFAPGAGGFGGDRGPSRPRSVDEEPEWAVEVGVPANAAVLYRLLGDHHHIHVDPQAAARIGEPRPVLHGLATLGIAAITVADNVGAHPADLTLLEGRFTSSVFPGEAMTVAGFADGRFAARTSRGVAIDNGRADFAHTV